MPTEPLQTRAFTMRQNGALDDEHRAQPSAIERQLAAGQAHGIVEVHALDIDCRPRRQRARAQQHGACHAAAPHAGRSSGAGAHWETQCAAGGNEGGKH